jgi:diacylglycerol kinase (ATP)
MLGQDYHRINRRLSLEINGRAIPIPDHSQGIIFANIDSFAGGSRLWQADEASMQQAHDDGLVEAVSVDGPLHLGRIKTGISHGERLGQCRRAELHFLEKTHVQFDGEPEIIAACRATIAHAGQALMLCNSGLSSSHRPPAARDAASASQLNSIVASELQEAQSSGTIDDRMRRSICSPAADDGLTTIRL